MAIQIGGKNVPKQLADSPLFDVMQYGATVRRVSDELIKKAGGNPKGPLRGVFAATVGLAEEVPFAKEMLAIRTLTEADTFMSAADQKAASILIPGAAQWAAAQMDKETPFSQFEQPTRRKADTFEDALKKNIPWLRQEVPKAKIDRNKKVSLQGTSPTGKPVTLNLPAGEAVDMLEKKLANLNKLKDSLT